MLNIKVLIIQQQVLPLCQTQAPRGGKEEYQIVNDQYLKWIVFDEAPHHEVGVDLNTVEFSQTFEDWAEQLNIYHKNSPQQIDAQKHRQRQEYIDWKVHNYRLGIIQALEKQHDSIGSKETSCQCCFLP